MATHLWNRPHNATIVLYNKNMIRVDIPGRGLLEIGHFVTDFSGTLSEDGVLVLGMHEALNEIAGLIPVHVLTSDTFGAARRELEGVRCELNILKDGDHMRQKEEYVRKLGARQVAALGNGANDVLMLGAAALSIAVCLKEGCAARAMEAADILVTSPLDAVGLLLNPKRLVASLRV